MKNSLIEKLYVGQDDDSDLGFLERTVEDIEQEKARAGEFYASLSAQQRQAYLEVQSDCGKQLAYQMQLQYRRGFRAGAKMMMEILTEEE